MSRGQDGGRSHPSQQDDSLFPQPGRTEANPSCPPSERPRLRHNGWGLSRTRESTDRPSRRPAPPITAWPRLSRPELARRHAWHPPTTGRTGGQRLCAEIRESSGPPVAQGGWSGKRAWSRTPGKREPGGWKTAGRERRREISYRTISLRLAGGLCPPTVTVNTTHLGKMMGLSVNSLRTRPPGGKAAQTQGQRPESLVRLVKEHRA